MSKETIPQSIIDEINKEADDHAVIMSEGLNSDAFNMLKNTFREAAIWGYGLDKWISVKDGLPDESGRYWCYVEEINDLGISHYQWNVFYSKEEDRWSTDNGDRVTHYQYLPKPPIK